MKRCSTCGTTYFYENGGCPHCGGKLVSPIQYMIANDSDL